MTKEIKVHGARQNNLKNIDVSIPYYELTVVTGDSGSGKSSLVYDTIYAESQRLMYESLIDNTFGMKIMDKPDVDSIENLCPAISINQLSYNSNPNSTVGTYTDITSHIRSIFSSITSVEQGRDFSPRDFSPLQSRYQCPECHGKGKKLEVSLDLLIPDNSIPLSSGGLTYFKGSSSSFEMQLLDEVCNRHGIDINVPVGDLTDSQLDILLHGDENKYVVHFSRGQKKNCQKTLIFTGVLGFLNNINFNTPMNQKQYGKYLDEMKCQHCNGSGLQENIISYKVCGDSIYSVNSFEVSDLLKWCDNVDEFTESYSIPGNISSHTKQIKDIAKAMQDLSIEYLSPSRTIPSLSGGEFQRLRLAKQISGSLVEILYILDEPCKGLHRIDVKRIIDISKKLIAKGNTVLTIEHNIEYIKQADKIISIGPGSGPKGGYLIDKQEVVDDSKQDTLTISNKRTTKKYLEFSGIKVNNINNESCRVPLGLITSITGVSGSGKSTLAQDVIFESLHHHHAMNCSSCSLDEDYQRAYYVDQKPVGKNARSTVISYLKIGDEIRNIFAGIKVGKSKKTLPASYFSSNVAGGRCEKCSGTGLIQNHYLSDVYFTCDECNGTGFQQIVLSVKYKGKNIYDVMQMTVDEATEFFHDNSKIASMLKCLSDMGLGYLKLGQRSMNLSGGESQRLKLAKCLGEEKKSKYIYILDEPTSGLSNHDIEKISKALINLSNEGNTIIMIEHNVRFINSIADYIIDFGFNGGKNGGHILDQGYVGDVYSRGKASIWFDKH